MPSLTLTPRGHLLFTVADDAVQPSAALSRRLESAFARGSGHGSLELGAAEVGTVLPADFGYWCDFAARLVTAICMHPDFEAHHATIPALAIEELEALAAAAPPMTGAEYITASVLETLWTETAAAWVEVDHERLSRMLDEFRAVETAAARDGLSFGEAMRLLAGAHVPGDIAEATAPDCRGAGDQDTRRQTDTGRQADRCASANGRRSISSR